VYVYVCVYVCVCVCVFVLADALRLPCHRADDHTGGVYMCVM